MATAQNWLLMQATLVFKNMNSQLFNYQRPNFRTTTLEEHYLKQSQNIEKVRRELTVNTVRHNSYDGLIIVDALQRLGIHYQFKDEIEQVLAKHYNETVTSSRFVNHKDLYFASLCFRLLRQQHYYVPADGFDNFLNKERKKRLIGERSEALMSLYEASQLRIKGEDVLDEAEFFSCRLLKERIKFLDNHQARELRYTIAHPRHKTLARLTERQFIIDVNNRAGCKEALKELAHLNSAVMESTHKTELTEVSRWWKDLGLAQELKLARDQPQRWHMWAMNMLKDPRLSEERIELTKPISLIYMIDDLFDVYGTVDELALFTEAVNRWDIAAIEQLPDYMKKCFRALHEITNEIGHKVYNKHGLNPVYYLAEAWATLCNAFLEEAKWFASGHLPKADEYLQNGIVSSGVHIALVHLFFVIGDGSTKEQAEFFKNKNSALISYVAAILRLSDDLESDKDENQIGKDGSYVACYMNEHPEVSVENARNHAVDMISDTWKCLNKECLFAGPYSATFIEGSLNLARMVPLMYTYDDSQTLRIMD